VRVVHEQDGVVIRYYAHPLPPVPINSNLSGSEVYLVGLYNAKGHVLGFSADPVQTIELVGAVVGIICAFVNCPGTWRKVTKGTGKHTGFVTMENEGAYGSTQNSARQDCVGAAPTSSDGSDRAYLSKPSRCFGVSYQSWKYQQEGTQPAYDLSDEFARLAYGRTDLLTQLSLRDGAFEYAKTATQEPPGAWTTWAFYPVGTCNPC